MAKGRCLERQRWRDRQKGDRGRVLQTEILTAMFHMIKTERETDKDGDADREICGEKGATQTRVKREAEEGRKKRLRGGMWMM